MPKWGTQEKIKGAWTCCTKPRLQTGKVTHSIIRTPDNNSPPNRRLEILACFRPRASADLLLQMLQLRKALEMDFAILGSVLGMAGLESQRSGSALPWLSKGASCPKEAGALFEPCRELSRRFSRRVSGEVTLRPLFKTSKSRQQYHSSKQLKPPTYGLSLEPLKSIPIRMSESPEGSARRSTQ